MRVHLISALLFIPTVGFAQSPKTSAWKLSTDKSKMDDSPIVYLTATAGQPITGWLKAAVPELTLRCDEGKTTAYIVTGMPANPELGSFHEYSVRYRIDDQKAEPETWTQSTDNQALFAEHPRDLIAKLASAQRFRFEFTPFNSSPVITEFRVNGLSSLVGRLASACHWKEQDDSMARRDSVRRADSLALDAEIQQSERAQRERRDSEQRFLDSILGKNQPAPVTDSTVLTPLAGWKITLGTCESIKNTSRCTIVVSNLGTEKKGFRLENVHEMHGQQLIGDPKDFAYSPRHSYGYDQTEGDCEPSKRCTLSLTCDPATDALSFTLSIWSAGFATGKELESQSLRLRFSPP